jgi:hypothetical protein
LAILACHQQINAEPDPDPAYHFDADADPDLTLFNLRRIRIRDTFEKQCCGSGMFIPPDPDFYPSRIPDPKTARKERGEKNLLSYLFL